MTTTVNGRPGSGRRRCVLIVTAGMGGGHVGAAREIATRLEAHGYDAPILDFLDGMRAGYGRLIAGVYRTQLRYARWTYQAIYDRWRDHPDHLGFANHVNTAMARRAVLAAVARHQPVAILSTYNLATQVLGELTDRGGLAVPTYTFITDFGAHPYWMHPAMAGYLVVHPSTAATVLARTGAPVVVTGPFVDPVFAPDPQRRAATRASLGVDSHTRVALVVAGAWGVGDIAATLHDLDGVDGTTPVVVCGNNPGLQRRLGGMARDPRHVFGHVDTMPALMDAADVLVENAGGLTAMEAFASGLPVVTYRPIPAHGTDNARLMAAAGVTRLARDRTSLAAELRAVTVRGPARRAAVRAGRSVLRPDAIRIALDLLDPPGVVGPGRTGEVDGPAPGDGWPRPRRAVAEQVPLGRSA